MTDTEPRPQGAQTSGFPPGPGPEHGYGYGPHGQGHPVERGSAYGPGDSSPGGYGPGAGQGPGQGGPGSPTGVLPPPPPDGPATGPGGGRRRGRPLVLASAALAALLVAGGIGGAVGYGAASSASGGGSVLATTATSGEPTAATAPAPAGSVEAVAQTVLPSVVQLRGASGEGSGIVISADGLILTNAHVLEAGQAQQQQSSGLGGLLGGGQQTPQQSPPQAAGLTAVFQNGSTAPVQVVGTDATADLAVVRAQNVAGLTPVQLGDSDQLRVGQEVVAVGSPLGLSGTVTTGIVSAMQRPVATGGAQSGQSTVIDAIQTDAAINPGNSGGALVDMQGRVVGITSAIASLGSSSGGQQSGSIGLGFAIPIDQAARIGQELIATGSATRAVLGVQVADATPTGATLGPLTPGGPAAAAGLVQGDVVTRLNDRVIDDADSLVAAIRSQQPGAAATLTVASPGGAPRQVPLTLGVERAPSS